MSSPGGMNWAKRISNARTSSALARASTPSASGGEAVGVDGRRPELPPLLVGEVVTGPAEYEDDVVPAPAGAPGGDGVGVPCVWLDGDPSCGAGVPGGALVLGADEERAARPKNSAPGRW